MAVVCDNCGVSIRHGEKRSEEYLDLTEYQSDKVILRHFCRMTCLHVWLTQSEFLCGEI